MMWEIIRSPCRCRQGADRRADAGERPCAEDEALSRIAVRAVADAAWKKVTRAVTALNKIETDHPIPLIFYYRSLQMSGKDISEVAALWAGAGVAACPL